MDGVWRLNAPQWTDFASSPQPLDDDGYFDQEHEELEPKPFVKENILPPSPKTPLTTKLTQPKLLKHSEIQVNKASELKDELLKVKETPVKIISPPIKNKNNVVVKETTFDNVLSEAMASLRLSTKKKPRRSTNIESTPSQSVATPSIVKTKAFKLLNNKSTPSNPIPMWIKKTRQSRTDISQIPHAVEPHIGANLQHQSSGNDESAHHDDVKKENKSDIHTVIEMCSDSAGIFSNNGENLGVQADLNGMNDAVLEPVVFNELRINDTSSIKTSLSLSRRQSNISQRSSYSKKRGHTFATSQLRRRSLTQYRRRSNKYISMAEAIAKFQNGTPKRFRTTSNKSSKPKALQRVRQSTVTATVPISPALRCKSRTRAKTILSREEREAQELHEMRKNPIKAKPVPFTSLNAPVSLAKKITAASETSHLSECKNSHDPKPKVTVPAVVSTDDGIAVKGAEILHFGIPDVTLTRSSTTKTLPFSFEMRNKEQQRKKEQKIHQLMTEEEKKIKVSFHARPVPKFKKPVLPVTKDTASLKPKTKPCPFSFEERNKNMVKKKENLIKAVMEEDRKARLFQAKPVPEFKPVLVRGTSRENLCANSKTTNAAKGRISMLPVAKTGSRNCLMKRSLSNQENQHPAVSTNVSESTVRSLKSGNSDNEPRQKQMNVLQEFHLNTDKRAKDRKVFDAKIRQKEQEAELLRKKAEVEKFAREEAEKAEMRRKAQTKARPMPTYKPPAVIQSDKELTIPQSPGWSAKPGH